MSKTVSLKAFFEKWRHRSIRGPEWNLLSSSGSKARGGVPLIAWPLLVAAVLAVSSAATAFKLMDEVPAFTLAAWRLQLTSVLLLFGAAHQWRGMDDDARREVRVSLPLLIGSGTCLAVHFGAWVWGLQHTSLTHSLLFVSTTPILLVGCTWILRQPITRLESSAALLGVAGGAVLASGAAAGSQDQVGVLGDLASLLAAAAMVGYLAVGQKLRIWMPIFVYAFPVTATAAMLLSLLAVAFETGGGGVLGWLLSKQYLSAVLYLAVVPGIVGHTGFNTLLRYLSPLTVSLGFQMEPLVGSVIGWCFGVMGPPGVVTYIGGAMVLTAACIVSVASNVDQQ